MAVIPSKIKRFIGYSNGDAPDPVSRVRESTDVGCTEVVGIMLTVGELVGAFVKGVSKSHGSRWYRR